MTGPRCVAALSVFLFKYTLILCLVYSNYMGAKLTRSVTYLVFGVVKLTEWHTAQAQFQHWRGEMLSIFFWHLRNEYWQNNTTASTWRHDILLKDIVWPISILWFRTITHCTHRKRAVRIRHANCLVSYSLVDSRSVAFTKKKIEKKKQNSHTHITSSRSPWWRMVYFN